MYRHTCKFRMWHLPPSTTLCGPYAHTIRDSAKTYCSRKVCNIEPWSSDLEKKRKSGWKEEIRMIICKRPAHPDDHLQKTGPFKWSFAKGRLIQMIICKRPAHPYNHLQKHIVLERSAILNLDPQIWRRRGNLVEKKKSGWSFAKGRPIQMVVCKRPAHPDDHLQKTGQLRWSFAKGWLIQIIICQRPAHPDNHLQKVG